MERMTAEEFRKRYPEGVNRKKTSGRKNSPNLNVDEKGEKESKYKNKPGYVGDLRFDSQKEMQRYNELSLLLKAGLIRDLRMQVEYVLLPPVLLHGREKEKKAAKYVADFVYFDLRRNQTVIEDVKSKQTASLPLFLLKKHAMKALLGLDVEEV